MKQTENTKSMELLSLLSLFYGYIRKCINFSVQNLFYKKKTNHKYFKFFLEKLKVYNRLILKLIKIQIGLKVYLLSIKFLTNSTIKCHIYILRFIFCIYFPAILGKCKLTYINICRYIYEIIIANNII